MTESQQKRQSPIDLVLCKPKYDETLSKALLQIQYDPTEVLELVNTGNSFKFNLKKDAKSNFRATGYLPDTYQLLQVHAHWGEKPDSGSEHTVAGKGYAAEVHFVHQNTKYSSFDEALKHHDGLAVIGMFLEEGQHNSQLDQFFQVLQKIQYSGDKHELQDGFDLSVLLPEKKHFWAYEGSLTTPPYTECVLWTVLLHPVKVSTDQLKALRGLHAVSQAEKINAKTIQNNVRPVQPVFDRLVRVSVEEKSDQGTAV